MKKIIMVLALSLSLFGCSGSGTVTGNIDTDRLGIKLGTMKYIGEDAAKASRILSTLDSIESELDADQIVLAEGVAAYIESKIDFTGRPIEEVILLQELVRVVSLQIDERIDGQIIDADSQVVIKQVIGWIRDAAELKLATIQA